MSEDTRKRRDLLNLWASDFMHRYKPDAEGESMTKLLFHQMAFQEGKHGSKLVSEPYYLEEKKIPTYLYGEALALMWEIPITQMALAFLVLGCPDANAVRMILAAVYVKYLRMGPPSDTVLDTIILGDILQQGTATAEFLDQCWELQKIKCRDTDIRPEFNLLDTVVANDFKRI